ncbi:hypothetical protein DICVIV_01415 [Dictyocaulus viviparus]|uniref:SCP domain-containing protein n=1 Tax=Dictyocaulus viviparus TaxID=29172 RepID=A0A0D8Y6F3_DICVI|nr:hypothetical protein DICVIV_01415 [Dictyocaulus viviparus]
MMYTSYILTVVFSMVALTHGDDKGKCGDGELEKAVKKYHDRVRKGEPSLEYDCGLQMKAKVLTDGCDLHPEHDQYVVSLHRVFPTNSIRTNKPSTLMSMGLMKWSTDKTNPDYLRTMRRTDMTKVGCAVEWCEDKRLMAVGCVYTP